MAAHRFMTAYRFDVVWLVECKDEDDPLWRFVQPFETRREAREARDDFRETETSAGGETEFRVGRFIRMEI